MFPIPMIIFASTILKRKPQVRGFILELLCGYLDKERHKALKPLVKP
jgi:hypothetical protein